MFNPNTDKETYGLDSVGKKYNYLTVLEIVPSQKDIDIESGKGSIEKTLPNEHKRNMYRSKRCKVQCDCGLPPTITYLKLVLNGRKTKCDQPGCKYATRSPVRELHIRDNPAYSSWSSMHKRCYNPNFEQFHLYGGIGITVADVWNKNNPTGLDNYTKWWNEQKELVPDGYAVYLENGAKEYSPDNCRLITKEEHSRIKCNGENRNEVKDSYGKDDIGKKYHHLTILELIPSERDEDILNGRPDKLNELTSLRERANYGSKRCRVQCDCGSDPFIWILKDIRNDRKRQCDTFTCQFARRRTHIGVKANDKDNPAYRTWTGMHLRCYDPDHKSYPNYGGKGIKVCNEWNENNPNGLKNFTEWWVNNKKGLPVEYTVDRIDTTKDYSPDNCRFASKSVQSANRQVRDMDRTITPYKCVTAEFNPTTQTSGDTFKVKISFENRAYVCGGIPSAEDGLFIVCLFKAIGKFDFTPLSKFEYYPEVATKEESDIRLGYKLTKVKTYLKSPEAARDPGYHYTVYKLESVTSIDNKGRDFRCIKWKDETGTYHYSKVMYPLNAASYLVKLILLA